MLNCRSSPHGAGENVIPCFCFCANGFIQHKSILLHINSFLNTHTFKLACTTMNCRSSTRLVLLQGYKEKHLCIYFVFKFLKSQQIGISNAGYACCFGLMLQAPWGRGHRASNRDGTSLTGWQCEGRRERDGWMEALCVRDSGETAGRRRAQARRGGGRKHRGKGQG